MRKFLLFISAMMVALSASAQYYLNGTLPGTDWNFGYEFNGTATIACEAGVNYEFKITEGASWNVQYGFSALANVPDGVIETGTYGGNIGFQLPQAGDVTISISGGAITLSSTVGFGAFVVPEWDGTYYIAGKGVEGSGFCCDASWDASACPLTNGTVTYNALPAGEYAFKITNGTWNSCWGYSDLADATGLDTDGTDNNVLFTLTEASNVTISYDGSSLYVSINGQGGDAPVNPDPIVPDPIVPDPIVPSPEGTGYSVLVNGTDFYAMEDQGAWDMDPSYNQFALTGLPLKEGDSFVFYNNATGDTWGSVIIDTASVEGITGSGSDFTATAAGCYSVYLKLKFEADNVYFGAGSDCPETPTDIEEVDAEDAVVAAYDLIGRPVAADAKGLVILQYASGKAVKVYNN